MMVEEVGTRRSHDILQNLACLLMSLRKAENNGNSHLFQLLCPEKFDIVVQCVMDMSKINIKMGPSQVGTPSLASHIGLLFQEMHRNCWWKTTTWERRRSCCRHWAFNKLVEVEWNYHKSNYSMTTLKDRRHNQRDLPVTSDLQRLKEYTVFKIISLSWKLQSATSTDVHTWQENSVKWCRC